MPRILKPRKCRVLVTGSRSWPKPQRIFDELSALHTKYGSGLVVVHKACPLGTDLMAEQWCRIVGVKTERWPADSNTEMVMTRPNLCLAFIHHESSGSTRCYEEAKRAGIPTRRIDAKDC